MDELNLAHRNELETGSAIAPAQIEKRGYRTVTDSKDLLDLGFSKTQAALVPGLLIPLWGVDGDVVGHQFKPDNPRTGENGKPLKYETPAKWKMRVDVGPGDLAWKGDPTQPIVITEGVKKADCGVSQGLIVLALIGVWNWRGASGNGGTTELGDWEAIALKDRIVHLIFDSDILSKKSVATALRRFAGFLRRRGAKVDVIVPPDDPGAPGKTGLDDYFVRGGDVIGLFSNTNDKLLQEWEIMTVGISMSEVRREMLAALVDANLPATTFVRAGKLSRVVLDERGIAKIDNYSVQSLRGVFSDVAKFVKPKNGGKKKDGSTSECFPPREVVEDVLALGQWPEIPPLVAITKAPVLAPDGTISDVPGYCEASGFFVASRHGWPKWDGSLHEAVALIRDVLVDFPFAGDADFAHALALMLLPIVRPYIQGPTPLHLIDAPVQGTGKSLLAEVLLMPTMGDKVSATPGTRDEEEWRKKIASALLEGRAYLWLDNLSRKVDSDSLAGALTSTEWNDRALGTMNNINVPIRVVWVATTNNAELSLDILRRTVWIRLDAKLEHPSGRVAFRHPDIKGFIIEHRLKVVSALCAIVRAWVEAGRPVYSGNQRLGSYEPWVRVMGGILDVAGIPGFLANTEELRIHADSEEGAWADFYQRWKLDYGDQPVKAGNVMTLFSSDDDLAAHFNGKQTDQARNSTLGKLLGKRVGVVAGGLRIERVGIDAHTKGKQYRIVAIDAGGTKPAQNHPQ